MTKPSGQPAKPIGGERTHPLARHAARVVSIVFLLSVLGYPVVGIVTSFYEFDNNAIALSYRAGVAFLAIYGVGLALSRMPPRSLAMPSALLLIFVLYSIRLVADALSGRFPDIGIAAVYFFGTCVIPALPVCLLAAFHDPRKEARNFLLLGAFICLLIVLMQLVGITGFSDPTQETEGRFGLERLNSISIGHVACTTIIAAIAIYFEPWYNARWRIIAAAAVVIAVVCIVIAGSRGPIVSLAAAILALLVFQRRWKVFASVGVLCVMAAVSFSDFQGSLVDRLLTIGSDQSSIERFNLQSGALEQFQAKPITGSAYVELVSGFYPHNIIMDAAMSLGVVGLGLMLWLLVRASLGVKTQMGTGQLLLPLVTVQYMTAAQFSGAIANSHEFWVPLALTISAGIVAARRNGFQPRQSAGMQDPLAAAARPERG